MEGFKLETGGEYYYLQTITDYFYDPHGSADEGGITKQVIKTKYKMPQEILERGALVLDNYTDNYTIDSFMSLLMKNNPDEIQIKEFIEGFVEEFKDIESLDTYEFDILDLPKFDDSDTYAQDGYNCTLTYSELRELKNKDEVTAIKYIIEEYNSL